MYVSVCGCICVHLGIYGHACVWVYMRVVGCLCMYLCVDVHVRVNAFIYIDMGECIRLCVCGFACLYLCEAEYKYEYVLPRAICMHYIDMHVSVCVCGSACICLFILKCTFACEYVCAYQKLPYKFTGITFRMFIHIGQCSILIPWPRALTCTQRLRDRSDIALTFQRSWLTDWLTSV